MCVVSVPQERRLSYMNDFVNDKDCLFLQNVYESFRASDMEYELDSNPVAPPSLHNVQFGTLFTPHMLMLQHNVDSGWRSPKIQPFAPISLHPASQVLHYGMTCFEGMKAFKGRDGCPRLFRPELNMARFLRSIRRLQLAPFNPDELLDCIKSLIRVDEKWLPEEEGHSLYIRPFAFSSSNVLGVARATQTTVSVILSPVGPYFPSGLKPITLFIDERNVRAWPGGVGEFKIGGNYAPTILPQVVAAQRMGAQQVVYTFRRASDEYSLSRKPEELREREEEDQIQLEECGSMNLFFLFEKEKSARPAGFGTTRLNGQASSSFRKETRTTLELATPQLQGTILPGVTRDSILQLANSIENVEVSERPITLGELRRAASSGRLREIFGSGTACGLQPVKALLRESGEVICPTIRDPSFVGALAPRLYEELLAIQYGRRPGHPWSVPL